MTSIVITPKSLVMNNRLERKNKELRVLGSRVLLGAPQ